MWSNKKIFRLYFLRIILFIAIILWMLVIFGFSATDGAQSQSLSDNITKVLVDVFVKDYYQLEEGLQTDIWNRYSFVVRKVGHFGEYAILGVLLSGFSLTYKQVRENKRWLLLNLATGVLYAITDEIHQGFVDGRSPKVLDVLIDASGLFVGMIFLVLLSVINIKGRLKNMPKT